MNKAEYKKLKKKKKDARHTETPHAKGLPPKGEEDLKNEEGQPPEGTRKNDKDEGNRRNAAANPEKNQMKVKKKKNEVKIKKEDDAKTGPAAARGGGGRRQTRGREKSKPKLFFQRQGADSSRCRMHAINNALGRAALGAGAFEAAADAFDRQYGFSGSRLYTFLADVGTFLHSRPG